MTGVTSIRQNVTAVAGLGRNIIVNAAGGTHGLNGTRPRRVTPSRLKVRNYAHFDDPLGEAQLGALIITPESVAKNSFLPLLGYEKTSRKIDFDVFPPLAIQKSRPIRYAGHLDSAIYATYALALSERYEDVLARQGIGDVVLAYRGGIGYNVPFARSLFNEIGERGDCLVLCLDLSKFFDTLDHKILRSRLLSVLEADRLSDDWHAIIQRLTRFEYVDAEALTKRLGKAKGRRICGVDTFREVVRPLIQRNANPRGIPQGTPLSGLLANIYMLDFDATLRGWVHERGGSYRRYSDDIAVVLPTPDLEADFMAFIREQVSRIGLILNEDKTCRTEFVRVSGQPVPVGDQLQYLGFTFDGNNIRIRPESMKAFYARMKRNVRRYVRAAKRKGIAPDQIRRRVIVGRFTHWGDNRNFVQYAYRAARELDSTAIRRQLRNHVSILDRYWQKMIDKYYVTTGHP